MNTNESGGTIVRRVLEINPSERDVVRFWKYVVKGGADDCWVWIGGKAYGYGMFRLKDKTVRANRFSWVIAHGQIPHGLLVCHNCPAGDNPSCVNPDHLFLGTNAENSDDMAKKGRAATGDRNGQRLWPERTARGVQQHLAKLDDTKVREIRTAHAAGESMPALALRYNVWRETIDSVIKRRTWDHVE